MNSTKSLSEIIAPPLVEEKKEVKQQEVYIFISNCDLSQKKEVNEALTKHSKITEFSSTLFLNRTLEDLVERDITKIWLNISNKEAKNWFRVQIVEDDKTPPLTVIPVYAHKDAWIDNVKEVCEKLASDVIPISMKKLLNSEVLNFDDLIKELKAQSLEIQAPTCTACGFVGPLIRRLVTKKE